MRFLLLDIITDDKKFREDDEKMLFAYGGHRGLFHNCLGLEHHLDDIVPGLSCYKMISKAKHRVLDRHYDGILIGGSMALRLPELRELFQDRLGQYNYDVLNDVFPKTGILKQYGIVAFPEETIDIHDLNRKAWLMKPASGACSRGVIVGRSCSQKKWNEYCNSREYVGAVVQEYFNVKETALILGADDDPQPLEGHTKYGAFLYRGQVAGCEVMLRHGSCLVHGARDTYLSTCVW